MSRYYQVVALIFSIALLIGSYGCCPDLPVNKGEQTQRCTERLLLNTSYGTSIKDAYEACKGMYDTPNPKDPFGEK